MKTIYLPPNKQYTDRLPKSIVTWETTSGKTMLVRLGLTLLIWNVILGIALGLYISTDWLGGTSRTLVGWVWFSILSSASVVWILVILSKWIILLCTGHRLVYRDFDPDEIHPDPRYIVHVGAVTMMCWALAHVIAFLTKLVISAFNWWILIIALVIVVTCVTVLLVRWRAQNRLILVDTLVNPVNQK